MNFSNGRIWPYAIATMIAMVFGLCVHTVYLAGQLPVQKSDMYMTSYQDADKNANQLIEARIAFDKKYKVEYVSDRITLKDTVFKYKVTDLDSNPIPNAKIKLMLTRPSEHKYDKELENPKYENGIYSFEAIDLPAKGRWNIMAKVTVGNLNRFYNVKTDTRTTKVIIY
ncbi:MAG: hypothetical protein GXO30_04385 [Epsilonproteobacteria bacterium]|nr:hypothetical protein [Campylobacterota bacterium]